MNWYRQYKPDNEMIDKFMATGNYHVGTLFSRSDKISTKSRRPYWDVTCPVCVLDEYTMNGLCTGTFTVTGDNLTKGYIPCRCGDKPNYTDDQWMYRIDKRLLSKGEHISFVRIDKRAGYSRSRVHLYCEHHGDFDMSLCGFMYTESSCPSCAKTGFSRALPAHIYVLKIEGKSTAFTGYGISNKIDDRIKVHKKNLAEYGLSITEIKIFPCHGEIAAEIEASISKSFQLVDQGISGFIKEATLADHFFDVSHFVEVTLQNKIGGSTSTEFLGQ